MNINEIAQMAGVSRATVSRYLNNGYVSETKRIQIQKVIKETGYQPSTQAQTLRNRKSRLIGVILPKINSDSISLMVAGIGEILAKEGYQMILGNTQNQEREEINYMNVFSNYQVEGILLIATIFTKEHQRVMKELKVPVVVLGQKIEGYSCVYQDDRKAALEAADFLIGNADQSKGQSRFAYIGVTTKDKAVGKDRKEGVEESLKKHEQTVLNTAYLESDFTTEGGYEMAKMLLSQHPETDTILCATDHIALGCLKYLKETKRKVPEEIRIAGLGDTNVSSYVTPSLTTVRFPYRETGIEAARMLLEKIQNPKSIRKEIKMGYELIEREST